MAFKNRVGVSVIQIKYREKRGKKKKSMLKEQSEEGGPVITIGHFLEAIGEFGRKCSRG